MSKRNRPTIRYRDRPGNHNSTGGIDNRILTGLIIAIAIVGLYAFHYSQPSNALSHNFIKWEQAGSEVDVAKVNEPVTLTLDIYSNSLLGYDGQIVVKIRKDIGGLPDETVVSKTIALSIPMGQKQKQTIKIKFTPDTALVRGYFYKIDTVEGIPIYDPKDPEDRNELKVGFKASGGTVPKVTGVLFNDAPQIEIAAGTQILTKVKMTGTGTGILKVEIRKDLTLLPDESYTTLTKNIVLKGDTEEIIMATWNANAQGLGFRQYFARVYWNNDLIYDPTDPTQREYVKVTGGSGGGGGGGDGGGTGSLTLKSVAWTLTPNGYSVAKTTLHVTGAYDGVITVDVREDVSLWTDNNLASKQHTVKAQDSDITVETPFTAPASGSWVFVRVTPNIYDSTDPDTRKAQGTEIQVPASTGGGGTSPTPTPTPTQDYFPPTEPPAVPGKLTVSNIGFGYNQGTVTVSKGQSVPVYAFITCTGGDVYQQEVRVEIKKDLIGATDTVYTTLTPKISAKNGNQMWWSMGSFTPDESTSSLWGVRQYFARATANPSAGWEYDPTDPNTRNHVKVN